MKPTEEKVRGLQDGENKAREQRGRELTGDGKALTGMEGEGIFRNLKGGREASRARTGGPLTKGANCCGDMKAGFTGKKAAPAAVGLSLRTLARSGIF